MASPGPNATFIGLQQLPKPSRPVRALCPHFAIDFPSRSNLHTRCSEFSATNRPSLFALTSICPQQPLRPVTILAGLSNLSFILQTSNPYPSVACVATNTSSFSALIEDALSLYFIEAFTCSSIFLSVS